LSELKDALQAEVDAAEGAARAPALYRLARVLERHLDDPEAALVAYRELVSADPAAGPAGEAVARLLAETGRHAELLAFLEAQLDGLDDPNLVVTTLYRMSEIAEGPLEDLAAARGWYERILDTAPGYLPALEGLERVYAGLEDWERHAAVFEQRAVLAEDPRAVVAQLHRAGEVCEHRIGDADRALGFYRRALEASPAFLPSLDAFGRLAAAAGDWAGLAASLQAAAGATEAPNEEVSLTYRAARILADKVGDDAGAIAVTS
jgi:hypothetical protein